MRQHDVKEFLEHSGVRAIMETVQCNPLNIDTLSERDPHEAGAVAIAAAAREKRLAMESVAKCLVQVKELETTARVEIQRLQEDGSVARCRLTEDGKSQRFNRIADTLDRALTEKSRIERERLLLQAKTDQARAKVDEARVKSRQELFKVGPWAANSVLAAFTLIGRETRGAAAAATGAASATVVPRQHRPALRKIVPVFALLLCLHKVFQFLKKKQKALHNTPMGSILQYGWTSMSQRMVRSALRMLGNAPSQKSALRKSVVPPRVSSGRLSSVTHLGMHETEVLASREQLSVPALCPELPVSNPEVVITEGRHQKENAGLGNSSTNGLEEACVASSSKKSLADWGLGEYTGKLEEMGYDSQVLTMLRGPDEIDEMLEAIECKPGHCVRFRQALKSWK